MVLMIKMKCFPVLFLLFLTWNNVNAQIEPFDYRTMVNLDAKYLERLDRREVSYIDPDTIFKSQVSPGGLFYYALVPEFKTKGALVLLPGRLEEAESVVNHNKKLMQMAFDEDILVIVPSTNSHLYLDKPVFDFLNLSFIDAARRYNIPREKFVLGGFSLGGIISLRYTEMAYEDPAKTAVLPCAAFSVDGPVDFATIYRQKENQVKREADQKSAGEAKQYLEILEKNFGGSPEEVYDVYVAHSIYSRGGEQGGNARYLRNVPVRIYSDPDIDWAIKSWHCDYYDLNAPDQSALIVELNRQGNEKAEFVSRLWKGYRMDGTRNPHSWSLIEERGLITWILESIE